MRKQDYAGNSYQNSIYNDPQYKINRLHYNYRSCKKSCIIILTMIAIILAMIGSLLGVESLPDVLNMYNLETGYSISGIQDVIELVLHDSELCTLCYGGSEAHTWLTERFRDIAGFVGIIAMLFMFYMFFRIRMHKVKAELKRLNGRNF